MPKRRARHNTNNNINIAEWIYGALLTFVIAIMPIVVRFAVVVSPPELYALFPIELHPDFFSYYKSWALGISAAIIAVYAIFDWVLEGGAKFDYRALIKSPVIVASAVFLFFALVSALFSSYMHTSWLGTADRGEGMLILSAYFIVMFAAIYFVKGDKQAKVLMYGFAFSSIIMGLVGLSQFLEQDFFRTDIGQRFLMLGMSDHQRVAAIEDGGVAAPFRFSYGTLYNPNTFGKYTAMATPILLACALAFDGKFEKIKSVPLRVALSILVRIAFLVAGGLMLVGIFGSRSLAGFIGIGVAVAVLLITIVCRVIYQLACRKKDDDVSFTERKSSARRTIGWAVGIVVIAALGVGLYFFPPVNQRLDLALNRFEQALRSEPRPPHDIVFEGNRFTTTISGVERFTMYVDRLHEMELPSPMAEILDRDPWRIYDATGELVPLVERQGPAGEGELAVYIYSIPGYGTARIERLPGAPMFMYRRILMTLNEGNIYTVAPNFVDLIDLSQPAPAWGFEGREHWGSSRGYIWSRTFPLMPGTAIIGTGPDTYTQAFPQHDVVGNMFYLSGPHRPVDKAHNIYLQTWVTTGGISALALIFLYGFYLLTTFVSLIRSKVEEGNFLFGLRFGLLAGVSGFVVAAMSTDSTIGSTGVFYILLGIGFGINLIVKKQSATERA